MTRLNKGDREGALLAFEIAQLSQKRERNLAAWADKYARDLIADADEHDDEAASRRVLDEDADATKAVAGEVGDGMTEVINDLREILADAEDLKIKVTKAITEVDRLQTNLQNQVGD